MLSVEAIFCLKLGRFEVTKSSLVKSSTFEAEAEAVVDEGWLRELSEVVYKVEGW